MTVTGDDVREFNAYLRSLTDAQVLGVIEKESEASRDVYLALAEAEADRRGLERS